MPGVQVWRAPDGQYIAHGYRQGSVFWMHWPSLAAFRFIDEELPTITAFVEPGVSTFAVEDVYRRSVLPMAIQALGGEALHASAVVAREGVVAFAARARTGKSTLAYGLSRRGFGQWADDAVALRVAGGQVMTVPLPFEVRLRPESAALFGFDQLRFRQFAPDVAVARGEATALPLAAVCLLRRMENQTPTVPAVIGRLTPQRAFSAVLTHAHEFNPHDLERRKRMLHAYLEIVDTVPVYDVQFAVGGEWLEGVLDTLIGTLSLGRTGVKSAAM